MKELNTYQNIYYKVYLNALTIPRLVARWLFLYKQEKVSLGFQSLALPRFTKDSKYFEIF